jgi:menaquinone-dependent protoporphyrinogen IX oxidase
MSELLVLYRSKYGSAKQYAEWISSDLNADLHELSSVSAALWKNYPAIVFCGGIYAGKINGVNTLAKRQAALAGKKIIIAACGLSDPDNESNHSLISGALCRRLPPSLQENLRLFLLRGGISHSKLRFFDRTVMKAMSRMLENRDPEKLSPDERQLKAVLGSDFNFLDRALIQPIVEYCRTLEGKNDQPV